LREQAGLNSRQLSYGAKKRLELAMALASLDDASGLLLLDEPAAGLAPSERASLMQLVRALTHDASGRARLAVLYTEHNMDAVFGVADRVLVLMEGRLVAAGTTGEVAANEMVRTRYLGRTFRHAQEANHA
jgi:branched-chain amino acid transport system ATP-binding protein